MEDSTSPGNLQKYHSQIDDTLQQIWQKVFNSFEDKEYKRVAEYLKKAQVLAIQNNDPVTAGILTATHQLCLTECEYQAEIELQQNALDESLRREKQLRQQLQTILESFSHSITSNTGKSQSVPFHTTKIEQSPKKVEEAEPQKKSTFWQKVQDWLSVTPETLISKDPTEPIPQDKKMPPAYSQILDLEKVHTHTEQDNVSVAVEQKVNEQHSLAIYCLGPFRVYQNDQLVKEWNSLKGLTIFKYLVAQQGKPIAKDILMDVIWPNVNAEATRRNLHQAIYSLRQTLRQNDPDFQHIQFHNDCYFLNSEITAWIDFVEFEKHIKAGQRLEASEKLTEAISVYGIANGLYNGDFLEEELYEDWPRAQREHIRNQYLQIADRLSAYYVHQNEHTAAVALCQKVLSCDKCNEIAHRRLMRCYHAQGQRHLAIRQYQTCVEVLEEELNLTPAARTVALYRQISTNM